MAPTVHPLRGRRIAFTGPVTGIARDDLKWLLAEIGVVTTETINEKLDLLVVGPRAGAPSSKLVKAQRLAAAGLSVRIMTESEFRSMLGEIPWDKVSEHRATRLELQAADAAMDLASYELLMSLITAKCVPPEDWRLAGDG